MSMYPFSFEVVVYVGYNEETHVSDFVKESGMSFAQSFTDAVKRLEDYYGDDLTAIKNLTLYEEHSLIMLPTDVIRKYAKDEYPQPIKCDENGNPILKKEESLAGMGVAAKIGGEVIVSDENL